MTDLVVLAIGLVLGAACTVAYFALGRHAERLSRLEVQHTGLDAHMTLLQQLHGKQSEALVRLDRDAGSFAERLNIRRND